MRLVDFTEEAEIFIDANIFTYFALQNPAYQVACTTFLSRVEAGQVRGVTSVLPLMKSPLYDVDRQRLGTAQFDQD